MKPKKLNLSDRIKLLDDLTGILQVIQEGHKHQRVIWSPATLLKWLGIPLFDSATQQRRHKAKKVLEQLCEQGQLVRRPEMHSEYTYVEVAYMLPEDTARTNVAVDDVYDPKSGALLLSGRRASERETKRITAIHYLNGDATAPNVPGNKIIIHICNDAGKWWKKGFYLAVSKRWPQPEAAYRAWYADREKNDFGMGAMQLVAVEPDLWVANLIGRQFDEGGWHDGQAGRPDAMEKGLTMVAAVANEKNASVHMPRLGSGWAGGGWEDWEPIIQRTLCASGVDVYVYIGMLGEILGPLADGTDIPDFAETRKLLVELEYLISKVLVEENSNWKYECLDGIIPLTIRKVGEREIEVFGLCILISDQTTTPIHLRCQLSASSDGISWLECKLGEHGENGMVRNKYQSGATDRQLHALGKRADIIEWVYEVTFGQKRP